MNNLVAFNINVKDIFPHPKNPRKNLGDISELTESIRKNGVMQNLTVIPGYYDDDGDFHNEQGTYTVVIGHRRLAASKAAGLEEVPCVIKEDMSEKEQVATMLEENMQRNDLTIYEQGQGFQMMLDLGETVDTIVEKTGFSKTTVYHRINIAKLDQEELKKKTEDNSFQLNITDLIELEKLPDVEMRNEVLKNASDSNNLKFRVRQKLDLIEVKKKNDIFIADCKELGIKDKAHNPSYCEYVVSIDLSNYKKGDINKYEFIVKNPEDYAFWNSLGGIYVYIYKRINDEERNIDKNSDETMSENKKNTKEDNYDKLRDLYREALYEEELMVQQIIKGIAKSDDEKELRLVLLIKAAMYNNTFLNGNSIIEAYEEIFDLEYELEDDSKTYYGYEVTQEEFEVLDKLTTEQQLLLCIWNEDLSVVCYPGTYDKKTGRTAEILLNYFELYGFSFSRPELYQVVDGTHELYAKEEDED